MVALLPEIAYGLDFNIFHSSFIKHLCLLCGSLSISPPLDAEGDLSLIEERHNGGKMSRAVKATLKLHPTICVFYVGPHRLLHHLMPSGTYPLLRKGIMEGRWCELSRPLKKPEGKVAGNGESSRSLKRKCKFSKKQELRFFPDFFFSLGLAH